MLICQYELEVTCGLNHIILTDLLARQFGFDQGVPANDLLLDVNQRGLCNLEQLAIAWISLLRQETHAAFCIPRMSRRGTCSWWYCSYSVRSSAPYLGPSIRKVYEALTKKPMKNTNPIYIIENIRDVSTSVRGAVRVSELNTKVIAPN